MGISGVGAAADSLIDGRTGQAIFIGGFFGFFTLMGLADIRMGRDLVSEAHEVRVITVEEQLRRATERYDNLVSTPEEQLASLQLENELHRDTPPANLEATS
jgi:hypothetical protein